MLDPSLCNLYRPSISKEISFSSPSNRILRPRQKTIYAGHGKIRQPYTISLAKKSAFLRANEISIMGYSEEFDVERFALAKESLPVATFRSERRIARSIYAS